MKYGEGGYGEGGYGGPEPEEFEKQSEEEKNEDYRKMYSKLESLEDEVYESRNEAKQWRRQSWIWRLGSFSVGNISGLILSNLF